MSIPVLVDTWWTRGEVSYPDTSTAQQICQSHLWMIKEALLDTLAGGSTSGTRAGASVWTVEGSSNSTTAAMDGVDRWGASFTPANIVRAPSGSPHSWIVLRNTTLGVWFCIDYASSSDTTCVFTYSRSAFTGGSTTAKPTATNETSIGSSSIGTAVTFKSDTTITTHRFLISVNSTGEFHIATNRNGSGIFDFYMTCGTFRNQRVGDTWPNYFTLHASASSRGAGTGTSPFGSTNCGIRTRDSATRVSTGGILNDFGFGSSYHSAFTNLDALDGRWLCIPMYAMDNQTVSNSGFRGNVQDMYRLVGNPVVGGKYPFTGPQTMVVVGDLLIPCGVGVSL